MIIQIRPIHWALSLCRRTKETFHRRMTIGGQYSFSDHWSWIKNFVKSWPWVDSLEPWPKMAQKFDYEGILLKSRFFRIINIWDEYKLFFFKYHDFIRNNILLDFSLNLFNLIFFLNYVFIKKHLYNKIIDYIERLSIEQHCIFDYEFDNMTYIALKMYIIPIYILFI